MVAEDAGKRITSEVDVTGTELLYPTGWRELVLSVRAGDESDFSVSIDLGVIDGRFINIMELNPDLTAAIYKGLIDTRLNLMGVSWHSIGGSLSAHRRRFELARRCRQYRRPDSLRAIYWAAPRDLRRLERRDTADCARYEVSPYEIYARLYNRAHPARHISAKRLNRLQRERAWKLFYRDQMPADYRRQR